MQKNLQLAKTLKLRRLNERKDDTVRGMKRQNIILERIKQQRIVEGSNPLYKFILITEESEGLTSRYVPYFKWFAA